METLMAHEITDATPMSTPSSLRERFLGPWNALAYTLGIACSLYYMWVALVGIHYPQVDRSLFIFVGIALSFSLKPAGKSYVVRVIDALVVVLAAIATYHFIDSYIDFVNAI